MPWQQTLPVVLAAISAHRRCGQSDSRNGCGGCPGGAEQGHSTARPSLRLLLVGACVSGAEGKRCAFGRCQATPLGIPVMLRFEWLTTFAVQGEPAGAEHSGERHVRRRRAGRTWKVPKRAKQEYVGSFWRIMQPNLNHVCAGPTSGQRTSRAKAWRAATCRATC